LLLQQLGLHLANPAPGGSAVLVLAGVTGRTVAVDGVALSQVFDELIGGGSGRLGEVAASARLSAMCRMLLQTHSRAIFPERQLRSSRNSACTRSASGRYVSAARELDATDVSPRRGRR
jgi:hypothetical protein